MNERDWKIFEAIKNDALNRYSEVAIKEFQKILSEADFTSNKKHGALYIAINDYDRVLGRLFDGHSRSRANSQLAGLRANQLTSDELVKRLSQEIQDQTEPRAFG